MSSIGKRAGVPLPEKESPPTIRRRFVRVERPKGDVNVMLRVKVEASVGRARLSRSAATKGEDAVGRWRVLTDAGETT